MERLGLRAVYSRLVAGAFSEQTSGQGVCKPSGDYRSLHTHTSTQILGEGRPGLRLW